jgi:hypothetical protein
VRWQWPHCQESGKRLSSVEGGETRYEWVWFLCLCHRHVLAYSLATRTPATFSHSLQRKCSHPTSTSVFSPNLSYLCTRRRRHQRVMCINVPVMGCALRCLFMGTFASLFTSSDIRKNSRDFKVGPIVSVTKREQNTRWQTWRNLSAHLLSLSSRCLFLKAIIFLYRVSLTARVLLFPCHTRNTPPEVRSLYRATSLLRVCSQDRIAEIKFARKHSLV